MTPRVAEHPASAACGRLADDRALQRGPALEIGPRALRYFGVCFSPPSRRTLRRLRHADLAGHRPVGRQVRAARAGGLRPRDRLLRRPGGVARQFAARGRPASAPGRSRRRPRRAGRSISTPCGRSSPRSTCRASSAAASATKRRSKRCSTSACRGWWSAPRRSSGPTGFARCAASFPEQLALGIDARDGLVATDGWLETSRRRRGRAGRSSSPTSRWPRSSTPTSPPTACSQGPNVAAMREMQAAIDVPVIASGGVTTADDVARAGRGGPGRLHRRPGAVRRNAHAGATRSPQPSAVAAQGADVTQSTLSRRFDFAGSRLDSSLFTKEPLMARNVEDIRNIAFCGHGGAGKTTLVDQLLVTDRRGQAAARASTPAPASATSTRRRSTTSTRSKRASSTSTTPASGSTSSTRRAIPTSSAR